MARIGESLFTFFATLAYAFHFPVERQKKSVLNGLSTIKPRSNAVLHMSRTQLIEFGSCEIRRLTQLSSADCIWIG